ncbi:hypothetical protein [Leptolyngbya sp. FACHB-711]|uniref:hypothetical protein n=1 Tax=Leptolyngbya sp. FACHB-711 TaxID=2692813 RepID=UPI0016849A28|nr:hypothetical protein [Leptolyngbya sp. FACHB-711]MBD2024396.1 hypothetical protein [Leptolyngbya sp. FACHB-711]
MPAPRAPQCQRRSKGLVWCGIYSSVLRIEPQFWEPGRQFVRYRELLKVQPKAGIG